VAGRTQSDVAQLGFDIMPRTASERAMLRLSRTLLGSPLLGRPLLGRPLLGRPLLGRPLLGRPLLGQPLLGERGRRKSDWHWLFLDGLFHHAPIARPSGGDCCGRNQYTTVFRAATAAPRQQSAWTMRLRHSGDAPLPRCANMLVKHRPGNRGAEPRMQERRSNFDYEDLLACGRGELFAYGPQLPLPPMLMFDRISEIAEVGGEYGKGLVRAVLDLKPDLWFFPCHFKGDPVMPGCLGLDALWQLLGFFLGWIGSPGKGRALGMGE